MKNIRTVRSDSDCKNTSYRAQHGVLRAHMKFVIHEMAKEIYFYYLACEKVQFQLIFFIPKSRD